VIQIMPIASIEPHLVVTLLDTAFGADRHQRTAYRIRQGADPDPDLSFAAVADSSLVGTIQCWPIALLDDDGISWPLTMVGPVAVRPDRQRDGIGRMLMLHMLQATDTHSAGKAMMLIGDPEYYGRFFGFSVERTGSWRVPGPIDQRRLLARGACVPATTGMLGPRLAIPKVTLAG